VLDPTRRFSNRVQSYLKYRPTYPSAILPLLESECALTPESVIAEPGSGTGLLTKLFLENGNRVFGVEPNAEMREAGERELAEYPNFTSIEATAEATTLPDHSVDVVVAGQAFHWFDRAKARAEFSRILKPDGWVVLIWNGFRTESSPLMAAYHALILRHGTDYVEVRRELDHSEIESFFADGSCRIANFNFQQTFDYQGFEGRLLSSSFVPEPGHPNYEPMLHDLRTIFDSHQKDGKVAFEYETEVYYGR
jgi:SAM-dependent methyltransferase